uniref:26S proteasome non-ATPase regulatory subunit 5 n=1 Tax=Ananas comosus var. bracteatus TaxID=296719 RepID=A0A6V7NYC9_ANACO|nr:unnamed protein product [Ananas comosus var. bracteatus]
MDDAPVPVAEPTLMLEAASEFASYPGNPTLPVTLLFLFFFFFPSHPSLFAIVGSYNDASVKEFLDRFPLPMLFRSLQNEEEIPGLEETIVSCLDKIFSTKYGASFLPNCVPFIQAGLQANSQTIRCLACKAVSNLLENAEDMEAAVQTIEEHKLYPLLINCLVDGNEQTSTASLDAIKKIAHSPEGLSVIFPTHGEGSNQLKNLAANSSSLGRIRILSIIVKLFSISCSVATAVNDSNLLNLFEVEIKDSRDMLTSLSALELLYELVESPYSTTVLLKSTLLQLLIDMISNSTVDSVLRSRAALISGRLLSSADAYAVIDEPIFWVGDL